MARDRRAAILEAVVVSLVFTSIFLLLTTYGNSLFEIAQGVMLLYLPAGLNITLLLAFGLPYGLAIGFAGFLGGVIVLAPNSPIEPLIVVSFTTSGVEVAAVALLRRVAGRDWMKWRFREWSLFAVIMLSMPLFVASLGIANYSFFDQIPGLEWGAGFAWYSFFTIVLGWWLGDVIGVLTLAPFLLIHVLPRIASLRRGGEETQSAVRDDRSETPPVRGLVIVGQIATTVLFIWLAFLSPLAGTYHLFFLAFLPLLWVVITHGLNGDPTEWIFS